MTTPSGDATTGVALTELSERQRERALERYWKLRPHLEEDAPSARIAKKASLPLRTAERWVSRSADIGSSGLSASPAPRGRIRVNGTCRRGFCSASPEAA